MYLKNLYIMYLKQYKMHLTLYKPYFNAFKYIKMYVNAYIFLYVMFLCVPGEFYLLASLPPKSAFALYLG